MEAVEIQAVEGHLIFPSCDLRIVLTKPISEGEDVHVAPHPRWKSGKVTQRLSGCRILSGTTNKAVYAISIRPVAFDRYHIELLLLDEPACDARALTIEIVGAMRSLANQYQPAIADPFHQRIVVGSFEGERDSSPINLGDGSRRGQDFTRSLTADLKLGVQALVRNCDGFHWTKRIQLKDAETAAFGCRQLAAERFV